MTRMLRLAATFASACCCVVCCIPTSALALSVGRKYEMVSPIYKGGFGALAVEGLASDGDAVAYYSPGAFAGAPANGEPLDYIARRGSAGWFTTPLMAPAELLPYVNARDVSPALDLKLELGKPGPSQEGAFQEGTEEEFLLHSTSLPDTTAAWEIAGLVLKPLVKEDIVLRYEGASADFCHILLANSELGKDALLAEAEKARASQLYELDRGCGGEPVTLRLVGVRNKNGLHKEPELIDPSCTSEAGIVSYSAIGFSTFNAVADDGQKIFFTECPGAIGPHQLFVRLGGVRTVEVSRSLTTKCSEVPCAGAATRASADFIGASEDGSTVFFMTKAPLVTEDKDGGNDIYMARLGCPQGAGECSIGEQVVTSLTMVSFDPNGEEAGEVEGAVRLAPDGSRLYFVARGDLLSAAETQALDDEGRPAPAGGAENLYVYDRESGKISFVGDLCSGPETSGSIEDVSCPAGAGTDAALWQRVNSVEAQTAGTDGRYIIFATYAQLSKDDTDGARDVYRYDASSHALERVSSGEGGYDANGNNSTFPATILSAHWGGGRVQYQHEMDVRDVSEDGSRVVFLSAEPLSPSATNHLTNVYEWHSGPHAGEGSVTLVSPGSADEPVKDGVISPDGDNIFFSTVQGLVPQDMDGAPDIYDARIGGGFPESPAQREPCSSDACQGPLTNPAPLLIPGSETQPATQASTQKPSKATHKRKGAKKRLTHGSHKHTLHSPRRKNHHRNGTGRRS